MKSELVARFIGLVVGANECTSMDVEEGKGY
jgi:hypothetical protein